MEETITFPLNIIYHYYNLPFYLLHGIKLGVEYLDAKKAEIEYNHKKKEMEKTKTELFSIAKLNVFI